MKAKDLMTNDFSDNYLVFVWTNKSRKYLRDISDWIRLCYSCHVKYDMTDNWRKNIGLANTRKKLK